MKNSGPPMTARGVTASRIVLRSDDNEMATKYVMLTFNSTIRPKLVKARYLNCKGRPYVPDPSRCFCYQRFGHSSQACRKSQTWATCGMAARHLNKTCDETLQCVNWRGSHAAYYRNCPNWKHEMKISKTH